MLLLLPKATGFSSRESVEPSPAFHPCTLKLHDKRAAHAVGAQAISTYQRRPKHPETRTHRAIELPCGRGATASSPDGTLIDRAALR